MSAGAIGFPKLPQAYSHPHLAGELSPACRPMRTPWGAFVLSAQPSSLPSLSLPLP